MSYPDPSFQLLGELWKSIPDPSVQPTLGEDWNPIADDVGSSGSSHRQTDRSDHSPSPPQSHRASVTPNQSGFSHRQTTFDRSPSPPPASVTSNQSGFSYRQTTFDHSPSPAQSYRASVILDQPRYLDRQTTRSDHSPTPPPSYLASVTPNQPRYSHRHPARSEYSPSPSPPYSARVNSNQPLHNRSDGSVSEASSPLDVLSRPRGGKVAIRKNVQFYKNGAEWTVNNREFYASGWRYLGEPTRAEMTLTYGPNGALIESETTVFVPDYREDAPEGDRFGTTFNLASVGRYVHASIGHKTVTIWGGGAIERQVAGEDRVKATHAVKQGFWYPFIAVPHSDASPSAIVITPYRSRLLKPILMRM